MTILLG